MSCSVELSMKKYNSGAMLLCFRKKMMYSVRSKALHVTSLLIVIFFIGITYFLGYLRLYLQTDGNGIQSTSGKLQQPEKIYLRIEDNHIPTENQHLRTEDQHALTQNKRKLLP